MPDHVEKLIRDMPEARFKESEAARLVGMSLDTLRRWRRKGKIEPEEFEMGGLKVYLYSNEDIAILKDLW